VVLVRKVVAMRVAIRIAPAVGSPVLWEQRIFLPRARAPTWHNVGSGYGPSWIIDDPVRFCGNSSVLRKFFVKDLEVGLDTATVPQVGTESSAGSRTDSRSFEDQRALPYQIILSNSFVWHINPQTSC